MLKKQSTILYLKQNLEIFDHFNITNNQICTCRHGHQSPQSSSTSFISQPSPTSYVPHSSPNYFLLQPSSTSFVPQSSLTSFISQPSPSTLSQISQSPIYEEVLELARNPIQHQCISNNFGQIDKPIEK